MIFNNKVFMKRIRIIWDYTEDVILIYDEEGYISNNKYSLINKDESLIKLQKQIDFLYCSFIEYESHGEQVWFNKPKMKENKQKMLDLLKKLNDRINELNDGSFIVDDEETPLWESM